MPVDEIDDELVAELLLLLLLLLLLAMVVFDVEDAVMRGEGMLINAGATNQTSE